MYISVYTLIHRGDVATYHVHHHRKVRYISRHYTFVHVFYTSHVRTACMFDFLHGCMYTCIDVYMHARVDVATSHVHGTSASSYICQVNNFATHIHASSSVSLSSLSVSICLSLSLLSLFLSVSLSLSLSIYIYIYLSIYLSICLSVSVIYIYIYIYIYTYTYISE